MTPVAIETAGARQVVLDRIRTLWVDTGSATPGPANPGMADDGLAYFRLRDLEPYLAEIRCDDLGTRDVGFIGRNPFANPELLPMAAACLDQGLAVTIRTESLGSIGRAAPGLLDLQLWHPDMLTLGIVLPHHSSAGYEAVLGPGAWQLMLDVVAWFDRHGFRLAVEGGIGDETPEAALTAYARLMRFLGLTPGQFSLAPIRSEHPTCACGRTVARRWDGGHRVVRACPILPHDQAVEFGKALASAQMPVTADRPACAACLHA
jgi:hypothetical protein